MMKCGEKFWKGITKWWLQPPFTHNIDLWWNLPLPLWWLVTMVTSNYDSGYITLWCLKSWTKKALEPNSYLWITKEINNLEFWWILYFLWSKFKGGRQNNNNNNNNNSEFSYIAKVGIIDKKSKKVMIILRKDPAKFGYQLHMKYKALIKF
jgi:hypothetical protein